jgi:IS30 family transposase
MLAPEDFMVIQALVKRGVYLCDIAGQLGVHPRTVRRALQRGGAPTRAREPAGQSAGSVPAGRRSARGGRGVERGGHLARAPSEGIRRRDLHSA